MQELETKIEKQNRVVQEYVKTLVDTQKQFD
jgi:uncharacterized coiled-coil protein SlyX